MTIRFLHLDQKLISFRVIGNACPSLRLTQPFDQFQRRLAVINVVVTNGFKLRPHLPVKPRSILDPGRKTVGILSPQPLTIGFTPTLIKDNRVPAIGDLGFAPLTIKMLHVLDGVLGFPNQESIEDETVEVHKDAMRQEFIDLLNSGLLAISDLVDRRNLIGCIVIDMHGRILGPPCMHPVNEAFKGTLFLFAIMCPPVHKAIVFASGHIGILATHPPEIFKTTLHQGMPFDIKIDVES